MNSVEECRRALDDMRAALECYMLSRTGGTRDFCWREYINKRARYEDAHARLDVEQVLDKKRG